VKLVGDPAKSTKEQSMNQEWTALEQRVKNIETRIDAFIERIDAQAISWFGRIVKTLRAAAAGLKQRLANLVKER
jgi:hypothetical protein